MVQKQQISKLNQEKEVLLQAVDLKVDEFIYLQIIKNQLVYFKLFKELYQKWVNKNNYHYH